MKNKILHILLYILLSNFIYFNGYATDQFNFDVTEVEILNNGNIIKGLKKGTVKTNDGITIIADTFIFDKLSNILKANGNVEILDPNQDLKIYSDKAVYQKNDEIIKTFKNSKAIYGIGKFMYADKFKVFRNENILNAKGNVKIENTIDDHLITGDDFTYFKNSEKIISKGETKALIQSEYKITSKNVVYLVNKNILSSKNKTKIEDQKSRVYFIEKFNYQINQEILKGEKILIITNYNLPKSDRFFFKSAIINLNNQEFIAKNTEIEMHKDIFDNSENDPRLKGVSSSGDDNITLINKGIFTSCKKNDNCPPWAIKASKIKHDKTKKQIIYDNAVLKIYDFPVFYFPKFFHPDPSVKRQSGLLRQSINNSNILGSSLTAPYFKVISESKDLTFTPTWFDNDTAPVSEMIGIEYRQANKKSNFLADTGFVNGYTSSTTKERNNLSHLFLKYDADLDLEDYISSDFTLSYERVSGDNYLNIFKQYLTKSEALPRNLNNMDNHMQLALSHEKFNFQTGIRSYENLSVKNKHDRYSYNLPYYNFSKSIEQDFIDGNIAFGSSGNNYLKNTNQLETNIINNLTYNSLDFISDLGFKSNFGIHFKNLNSVGKKTTKYKSSPQTEILNLYNIDMSFPLIKDNEKSKNNLTPKLSFRFNTSDMKNYSSSGRVIDANNAFAINRFGLSDSFEAGRSLTLGLDYKKEQKNNLDDVDNINNYFEAKLATILRDKEEKFIPNSSSLNRTNSNLFGSIDSKVSDNFKIDYDFSLDNDFNTLEYNSIGPTFSFNNLVTTFNFIETTGERGDQNLLATSVDYNFDEKNSLQYRTRKNRRINLREYYDLVYQYKNDCLIAGIKYKKTYYSDGDLQPTENLLFTITLFPLTTYEYDADQDLKRYRRGRGIHEL